MAARNTGRTSRPAQGVVIPDETPTEAPPSTDSEQPRITPGSIGGLSTFQPATMDVSAVTMMIYGSSGAGKTRLAATASRIPAMSPVLLLDIEGGSLTLKGLFDSDPIDIVSIPSWPKLQKVYNDLYKGNHPYKTVVVDSVSEAQKMALLHAMEGTNARLPDSPDPASFDTEKLPEIKDWYRNSQPLDSEILTPQGWRPMGSIQVGDYVIGSKGLPTRVQGISPRQELVCYRVTFRDGTVVRCSGDHLWTVNTMRDKQFRTVTTRHMAGWGTEHSWAPPTAQPVQFTEKTLPLHPYLLGLYLADGSSNGGSVTYGSATGDKIDVARQYLPNGHEFRRYSGPGSWGLVTTESVVNQWSEDTNEIRRGLRELGLWEVRGPHKFVPELYLQGSVEQRLLLLQGLMDGDGSPKQHAGAQFASSSSHLARQVRELTLSLGGYSTITWTGSVHNVRVYLEEMNPFQLPHKASKYQKATYDKRRVIQDITEEPPVTMQCLSVESPDGLYITADYVLTHNSEQMRRFIRGFRDLPINTIFTALDMDKEAGAITTKWPLFTNKLSDEIPGLVSTVYYLYVKETRDASPNQRHLLTDKTTKALAKSRIHGLDTVLSDPHMEHIYAKLIG